MHYLIDTDWTIDHLANLPEATRLLAPLTHKGIAISLITYMEVYQGIELAPNPANSEHLFANFLRDVPVLPFTEGVARRAAKVRATLKRLGRRVNSRALDIINASTAIEGNLIFVTRNVHDYEDIPGLKLYPRDDPTAKAP